VPFVPTLSSAVALVLAAVTSPTVTATTGVEPTRASKPLASSGLADKKGGDSADEPPLLGTLAQLHTDERVMLDDVSPPQARFDDLLSDRATGSRHPLDAKLLTLLRSLARLYGAPGAPPRIELVSGFRSPKLNEMLRKKGHHVASHSQHSLGHACDFRVVPVGEPKALDPRVVEKAIRGLGWDGGVGVYPTDADWFVHADVGPNRKWVN
jgi:uncharacterized protein YcbK (DUF882 family)